MIIKIADRDRAKWIVHIYTKQTANPTFLLSPRRLCPNSSIKKRLAGCIWLRSLSLNLTVILFEQFFCPLRVGESPLKPSPAFLDRVTRIDGFLLVLACLNLAAFPGGLSRSFSQRRVRTQFARPSNLWQNKQWCQECTCTLKFLISNRYT